MDSSDGMGEGVGEGCGEAVGVGVLRGDALGFGVPADPAATSTAVDRIASTAMPPQTASSCFLWPFHMRSITARLQAFAVVPPTPLGRVWQATRTVYRPRQQSAARPEKIRGAPRMNEITGDG